MARMIPATKEDCDFQTKGEEKVYDLLKKLPDDCLVFYEVLLGERDNRPDFVIIIPNRGVVVAEVKDWGKDGIRRASRKEFEIRTPANNYARRKNPDWKCQVYLAEAKELMGTAEGLLDRNERLIVPTAYLVVTPNLTPEGFDEKELDKVMSRANVILRDEVATGRKFVDRVLSILPEMGVPLSA